jgi:large subunit ribosomal protein L30
MGASGRIRIKLKRSPVSHMRKHRETLRALGLRRPGRCVVKADTPLIRSMIDSVSFMVEVEPAED